MTDEPKGFIAKRIAEAKKGRSQQLNREHGPRQHTSRGFEFTFWKQSLIAPILSAVDRAAELTPEQRSERIKKGKRRRKETFL